MSKTKKTLKRFLWVIMAIMVAGLAVVAVCEISVCNASKGRVYSDVEEIPHREVGLLLGTSPKGRRGGANSFYYHRIDAAVALYEAGKVDRFIISGAKTGPDYDEPQAMREALTVRGVPDSILILDGQGFHTIESIVRAKEVFEVDSVTIISQEFHNKRSLYMAKHNGLDAIAYNAANTTILRWRIIMLLREHASRVKAVLFCRRQAS
jgi:SanA protein